MAFMPRISQPQDEAWTPDVEAAIATFGNRSRNEVLRYLSAHGPATRGDIVAAVSVGDPSVAKHLLVLEDTGAITVDVEPGRRHGRAPRYSVNEDRLKELLAAHLRYLLGQ
jgi:ArsR family transcriptional regulator